MHSFDVEADWRVAKWILEAAKRLVAYLEEAPSPSRQLSEELSNIVIESMRPDIAKGAFPEAAVVADALSNWAAKCAAAVERPWELEEDDC